MRHAPRDVSCFIVRVPKDLHRAIKVAAIEAEISMETWIADALTQKLATARAPADSGDDDDE